MSELFGNHIVGFPTRWLNYDFDTIIASHEVHMTSIFWLKVEIDYVMSLM